jgi:cytochrome subunit of sulfide dehydrogenase
MKINKHQTPVMICTILFSLLATSAYADVDKHGRNISASCAACHGTNGNSVGGAPALAGADKTYLLAQMKDFKSGTRIGTVMNKHAKGYTDEDIELIASFFAAQKPTAK